MPKDPEPLHHNRFLKAMAAVILVLLALYLLKRVDYLYRPLLAALSYLLTPVLLSLFLYYILRPLVRWLTKLLRLRGLAILFTFLLVCLLVFLIGLFGSNIIQDQAKDLAQTFSGYVGKLQASIKAAGRNPAVARLLAGLNLEQKLGNLAGNLFGAVQRNLFGLFSKVTNIGAILFLIPFILFYFLLDDRRIFGSLLAVTPVHYRERAAAILRQADATLARYMQGQVLIAVILSALIFLGYLLIGLPNAFVLALITMVTAFIPIFGALIGMIPAALIGLSVSPWTLVKVLLVFAVVQLLEGNLISPRLQGARMNIHPLMVLFVVLGAYVIFGVLGSLFAVPAYVVLRVVLKNFWAEKWLEYGPAPEHRPRGSGAKNQ